MSLETITVEERPQVTEQTTCRVCGRILTDPESVKAGIGPVCAEKQKRPCYFMAVSPDKSGYAIDENVVVSMPRFKWAEKSSAHCDSCGKQSLYADSLYCPHCGAAMRSRTVEVVPT